MRKLSRKRHILKTITWRLIGTLDTMLLSWIISGNPLFGLKIGFAEVITKMVLYYFHERVWFKYGLDNSKKRHIIKTVTWRIIGTLDTMILAWIITSNPLTGVKIGLAEIITKMIFYYGHERLWYKINYGIDNRRRKK